MQRAMEAASFSLCRAFPAPRTAVHEAAKAPFVSFHTHSSSALNFTPPCKKTRVIRTVVPVKASADNANSSTSQLLGLLLEVEGVLVDLYRFGHRQAFNIAFQKLGLDCANWTDPIYLDLARQVPHQGLSRGCSSSQFVPSWHSVVKIGPTVPTCMNQDPLVNSIRNFITGNTT